MNDFFLNGFNIETFNEDGNVSATLNIKNYSRLLPIFQHLPVEEKVKKIEVNRMRKFYTIDTLTSVDIKKL